MTATWYEWRDNTLLLSVKVQPRARRDQIDGIRNQRLRIRITAPPVDGAANRHLMDFLAREFRVPKTAIEMLHGENGRDKRLAAPSTGGAVIRILRR